jgi:16S rRNA (guanine527-N7)-methyltransferase
VLDVGSGGGLPGIPFAIARPDWHITLLDSNHKKTTFLRQVVIDLALKNVQVVTMRAEQYQPAQPFHLITARAFADIPLFIQLTRHLLAQQGQYIAFKGLKPLQEISQLSTDIVVDKIVPLLIPGLMAERHLVLLKVSS